MFKSKDKIKQFFIVIYLFIFVCTLMPTALFSSNATENEKAEVTIHFVDKATKEQIREDDVFGDEAGEEAFINKTFSYDAPDINGYMAVKSTVNITPENAKSNITLEYAAANSNGPKEKDSTGQLEIKDVQVPEPVQADNPNKPEDMSIGNDWKLSDFIYDKNKVIGFSPSGLEKVKTQKELVLPHINFDDGTPVDTVGINEDNSTSFRNRNLISLSDYNGNIKKIEGIGSNWVEGERSKGLFSKNQITTLNLKNIESIGSYAFEDNSIAKLVLPKLTYIGSSTFTNNKITEINEGDMPKLEKIDDVTFYGNNMTKAHMPSVKSVGTGAFWNNELSDVKFDNLETAGDSAFIKNKIPQVTSKEFPKIKYLEYNAFGSNPVKIVDLPSIVRLENAFKNIKCEVKDNFQNLEILGEGALSGKNITELTFPKLKKIENGAFLNNPGVDKTKYEGKFEGSVIVWTDKVDVPSKENYIVNPTLDDVQDTDFEEKDFLYDADEPSRVTGFSAVGLMKFRKRIEKDPEIAQIVLPARVKIIGPSAFERMGVTEIYGGNVEIVEDSAFWGNKLTDINNSFPKLRETKGKYAFGNNKLTNINIPTLEIVSAQTFRYNQIKEVTLEKAKKLGDSAFAYNNVEKITLPVVEAIGDLCFGAEPWYYAKIGSPVKELYAPNVKTIGRGAFMDHKLKALYLPMVEDIGFAAFSHPLKRSASIGGIWYDFYTESKLTGYEERTIEKVYLPKVKNIGDLAFARNKIKEIDIENVEIVGRRAFEKNQINDLDLPKIKKIDIFAFRDNSIKEVRANKNCEEIHPGAFDINGGITRVLLSDYENPNNLKDGYVNGVRRHVINPTKVTVKYQDENGNDLQKGFTEYILAPKTYDAITFFGYKVDKQTKTQEDNRKENTIIFKYKQREKVENTGGIELRQENEKSGNTGAIQERYLIGQNMNTKVYFDLTGPDVSYSKGVIKVYYDNRYIDDKSIKVINQGATQIESWKAHNGIIEIKIGKISGGYQLRFNIDWRFNRYVTPDNHRMEVNTQFENDDKILCTSKPIYLEGYYNKGHFVKTSPLNLPNYDYGSKSSSSDGPRFMGVLGKYRTPENTYEYKVVEPSPVQYGFSPPSVDRNMESFTITDTLPTYDAVKEDGTIEKRTAVFDSTLNPAWSLSADGKTVTQSKTFEETQYVSSKIEPLYLSFPDLKSGANVNNTASITMTPANKGINENDITGQDDLSMYTHVYQNVVYQGDPRFMKEVTKPRYSQGNYKAYIYDIKEDKEKIIPYIVRASSLATQTDLVDLTITDYNLDSRLYYYGISFPLDSHTAGNINLKIKAYKKLGEKMDPEKDTLLHEEDIKAKETSKIVFPKDKAKDIDYIQIVFPKDHKVYSAVEVSVDTKLRNPEDPIYSKTKPNLLPNHAVMSGNLYHKGTTDPASKRKEPILNNKGVAISQYSADWDNIPGNYMWHERAEVQIRDYHEGIKFAKSQNFSSSTPVKPGDEGKYYLYLRPIIYSNSGESSEVAKLDTSFKNLEMIDLMPKGVEPTEVKLNEELVKVGAKYEIINNYKDTGRQAIIVKSDKLPKGVYSIGEVSAQVTAKAPEGFLKNEAYITFDEEGNSHKVDRRGLKQKPPKDNSDREWIYDYASMRVTKAREMFAFKYIRNVGDLAWSKDGITTPSDGKFEYKLSLVNNLEDERTNVSVVDFFPYVGDTSIQEENIGNKVRPSRGSEFENTYDSTREIQVLDDGGKDITKDYDISYWNSNTPINYNDKSADDVIAGLKWSDKPAKNTRGIKVKAKQGIVIKGDGAIDVIIPMKAPKNVIENDFDLTGKKAWNTFVRKDDQTIRFVEPNKVFNEMEKPLGSIEFTKFGKLGATSEDKEIKPLKGAEFELLRTDKNENGEPVETVVATAKSDENGKVKFSDIDVLQNYKIREIETEDIKTGKQIGKYTRSETVHEISYKDFKSQYEKSSNFDIKISDKESQELFLNIQTVYGKVKLEKVNAKGKAMPKILFRIKGLSETNKNIKEDKYTDDKGMLEFTNLPEGKYKLTELTITAGTKVNHETSYVPIEPKEFTIDKDHTEINFTGENRIVNKEVQLLITKVGVKALSDIPTQDELAKFTSNNKTKLKGFKFKITEVDNPKNAIETEATDDNGVVLVKGLKPDTLYDISEIDTKDPNYKHNESKYRFKITDKTKLVDEKGNDFIQSSLTFANAERDKVGKIIIKKVDDVGKVLKDAEFKLYKKDASGNLGDAIDTKTTGDDGMVAFENLPFGEYVVKETKAPANHRLIDESIEIKIDKPEQVIEKTVKNPELISIQGKKTWKDDNNKDKKRPQEITINLLKNGEKIASRKVTEAEGWKWNFENLDKYEKDKEIKYTISEDAAHGYKTEITGNAKDGFEVTNTYKPPTPPEEPKTPETSDSSKTNILFIALMAASFAAIHTMRRKNTL